MPEYYAPSFRVDVNGARVSLEISKNVSQISVVTKPGTMDTFSLTLLNPYPELPWTHSPDSTLFNEGNEVTISLGYVDQLQAVFTGEITRLSPNFPESGMPTVGIEGTTRMHWLTGSRQTRSFQNVTDKQVVERIAQDLGLDVDADDPGVRHDYVMQANQSDLEFILERAKKIRYELTCEGRKLKFKPTREAESEVVTLVWGHVQRTELGANSLPLRSFQPTMNTRNQVNEVEVRGYNPRSKTAIVARAGADDQTTTMGASRKGSDIAQSAFRRPRREVQVTTPVASAEEATAQAKATLNDRAMKFVSGSGTTIGIPQLRSGSVVKLLGLGERFSGRYYLNEVTHTIGSSGYQTSFTADRNAIE